MSRFTDWLNRKLDPPPDLATQRHNERMAEWEAERVEREQQADDLAARRTGDPDRCGNCTCFRPTNPSVSVRTMICKRFPVATVKSPDDWCGEHDRRDDA